MTEWVQPQHFLACYTLGVRRSFAFLVSSHAARHPRDPPRSNSPVSPAALTKSFHLRRHTQKPRTVVFHSSVSSPEQRIHHRWKLNWPPFLSRAHVELSCCGKLSQWFRGRRLCDVHPPQSRNESALHGLIFGVEGGILFERRLQCAHI